MMCFNPYLFSEVFDNRVVPENGPYIVTKVKLEITLANHLHHKKRAETLKASTHILRIGVINSETNIAILCKKTSVFAVLFVIISCFSFAILNCP